MKVLGISLLACLSLAAASADAQQRSRTSKQPAKLAVDTTLQFEIYGFAQADGIFEFNQSDPNWFDVNRPTKLPAVPDEFGRNGHTWLSARQTRFGVKATKPTALGDVKAVFDFDMFGVGVDAGQTTIRLRHAYGQWGQVGDTSAVDIQAAQAHPAEWRQVGDAAATSQP